jgi:hypothetical protein
LEGGAQAMVFTRDGTALLTTDDLNSGSLNYWPGRKGEMSQ